MGQSETAAATPLSGDDNRLACYQVRAASGVISDQTPADPGSGKVKFRKDLQTFVSDHFEDCQTFKFGSVSWQSTAVERMCLFDLKKVKEVCTPVIKNDVEAPRSTSAPVGMDFDPADDGCPPLLPDRPGFEVDQPGRCGSSDGAARRARHVLETKQTCQAHQEDR